MIIVKELKTINVPHHEYKLMEMGPHDTVFCKTERDGIKPYQVKEIMAHIVKGERFIYTDRKGVTKTVIVGWAPEVEETLGIQIRLFDRLSNENRRLQTVNEQLQKDNQGLLKIINKIKRMTIMERIFNFIV